MRNKLKALLLIMSFCFVAHPALAQYKSRPYTGPQVPQNHLRFNVGYFSPNGDSAYWDDKELEFTGSPNDFANASVGLDYIRQLTERLGLLVTANFWDGDSQQSYRDYTDEVGANITHTTTVATNSVEVGLVYSFLSRRSPVIPYIGGAGGYYSWELEEAGDFIDFGAFPPEIFNDSFSSSGGTFGWSGILGLEIPFNLKWSLFLEGRWQDAKAELDGDFQGFGTLDLSGANFRIGASWGF
ncbi:MAG: outer membrane beta-barrel protein [Bacteroidia bacterium]|nr:outer membrane beta-barrel protein [Bacteroidia bacterium]